jgi:chaperonin GroES
VLTGLYQTIEAPKALKRARDQIPAQNLHVSLSRLSIDRSAQSDGIQTRKGELQMKVRPLHDRILLRRIEEKESVKGGIIIPDTAKEKPQEAEVIAVGNGKKTEEGKVIPLDVKAGDRILFGKYSGTEIKIDNEEYLIIREDEVLGVIEAAKQSAASGKR